MRRGFLAVGILVLFASVILAGCSLLRVPPSVDFTASGNEGAAPLFVAFDPVVEGAISYTWSFGDGHTSDELNPVHVYTDEGIYSVMLTVEFADHAPVTLVKKRLVTVGPALRKEPPVYLYWISEDYRAIRRGDLDGVTWDTVVSESDAPSGLAVGGGKIYWVTTTATGGKLESADLDGTNRQVLVTEENRLGSVAVDVERGKVYWTSWPDSPRSAFEPGGTWDGALKRANLDASQVEILVAYPSGSSVYADQVVVDPETDGLVLWSEVGEGFEGAILGSLPSPIDPHELLRAVGRPRCMALDTAPDHGARNLFYSIADEIQRVSLYSGWATEEGPETVAAGFDSPAGIALDLIESRAYVGTADGILLSRSDGTMRLIYQDSGQIGSIVLSR